MDITIVMINKFKAESQAKLTLHKSIRLWITQTTKTWWWKTNEIKVGASKRGHLIPKLSYGLHISWKKQYDVRLSQKTYIKVGGKYTHPSKKNLVSNQVVLSTIWYMASCTYLLGQTPKLAPTALPCERWSESGEQWADLLLTVSRKKSTLPIIGSNFLNLEFKIEKFVEIFF